MSITLSERFSALAALVTAPNDADQKRAHELMSQYQVETNKRIGCEFGYKDANGVLGKIAQGIILDVTPGLVQVLFTYNANVSVARFKSTNLWKSILSKDQKDIRSDVLDKALRACSDSIIYCLVQNADQISLNKALSIAIDLNDSLKTYILLKRGADASKLCEPFQSAVEKAPDEMFEALISEGNGVCQACRNKGLVQAAKLGLEMKAHILLSKGADVSFDEASALIEAIRAGHQTIAENIAKSDDMRKYPLLLDAAMAEAYSQKQYQLVDLLLHSGAKGPNINKVLAMALKANQLELARTLAEHGASVQDHGEPWLMSAARSGRPELLQVALMSKPTMEELVTTIQYVAKLPDINVCHQMIALLLSAGVRGAPVCETLIQILEKEIGPDQETKQLELVSLLLQEGEADINLFHGRCVALVVTQGRTELLDIFLKYNPSTETLTAGLVSAMDLVIADLRSQAIQTILGGRTGDAQVLREAAIVASAKRLRMDTFNQLIQDQTPQAVFSQAFTALTSENPNWFSSDGLAIVQTLLVRGASGPALDHAFRQAVIRYEQQAIQLLLGFASSAAFDGALNDLVQHSKEWQSSENLELIEELLGRCSDCAVNEFLLAAVSACAEDKASRDIVDTVFAVRPTSANVNYKNGEPLKRAIKGGEVSLLRSLVEIDATEETMTEAFMTIITCPLDEAIVMALLEVLVNYRPHSQDSICFDANKVLPSGLPPFAACLSTHPQSWLLVKRLVKIGCNTEIKFHSKIFAQKEAEPESVTVLQWALCPNKNGEISGAAIGRLIDGRADVNSVTSTSKSTPLIIAARYHRNDVIKKLLDAKAKPNSRDLSSNTALFYASQSGDCEAVQQLVEAKARLNDGSLHEAARNLHAETVSILIKGKHDPNFPSSRKEHEGRTAVQELALLCDGTRNIADLEDTISALGDGKANFLAQYQGRNALFLGLENKNPVQVLSALLNTAMWRDINNELNVYTTTDPATGSKYYYSPTMYLQKDPCSRGATHTNGLLGLLHQIQCVDRFYAEPGPNQVGFVQPDGATGMPKRLWEAEERRRVEEEKQRYKDVEHRRKIERQQEEARVKADLQNHSRQQRPDHSVTNHRASMVQGTQMASKQQAAFKKRGSTLSLSQHKTETSRAWAAQ